MVDMVSYNIVLLFCFVLFFCRFVGGNTSKIDVDDDSIQFDDSVSISILLMNEGVFLFSKQYVE